VCERLLRRREHALAGKHLRADSPGEAERRARRDQTRTDDVAALDVGTQHQVGPARRAAAADGREARLEGLARGLARRLALAVVPRQVDVDVDQAGQ
jgi:hypothetical protein